MKRLNMSIEELIEKSLKDLVSALTTDEACGKLIFPCYRDGNIRHSEQELRQIFLKNVEEDGNYFYSVETPTKYVYRFTNSETPNVKVPDDTDDNDEDNYKSARFDVSLYNKDYKVNDNASHHIEFKYGNPDQKNAICKDFLKLVSEVDLTNEKKSFFVHYLCVKTEKGWQSQTFPSLFKKYCNSIVDIEKSLKSSTNQDNTKSLPEKLSKNLMNYLQNITVYLLCFFETSKSSLTYRFSLNDLKNYIDKKMDDKNSSEKDWLWLNEKIFNTENSI